MRLVHSSALAIAIALVVSTVHGAQAQMDASKAVAGGGISVPGWQGKVDANEEKAGLTLNDAKLAQQGNTLQVTTGPAVAYWNPKNMAMGNYTVKATFTEPKFMNLMSHSHPYGVVIAGNGMGTANQSYLYCATYGDGRFIVRGFGPAPFQMNGGKGTPGASVNKAADKGQPVTNEIAVSVRGDKVECAVNGAVVWTGEKAALVAAGKLTSTDGVYGIRFAHNTEGTVTGLSMAKN